MRLSSFDRSWLKHIGLVGFGLLFAATIPGMVDEFRLPMIVIGLISLAMSLLAYYCADD